MGYARVARFIRIIREHRSVQTIPPKQKKLGWGTRHIDSQLQWSMYSHALVDAHSFVLYYGSRSFTVIPKRVFPTAEREAFEKLLARNVPEIVRKDT
jgi:hypothetical protein